MQATVTNLCKIILGQTFTLVPSETKVYID